VTTESVAAGNFVGDHEGRPYITGVALGNYVDLFRRGWSQVRCLVYQGMALAVPQETPSVLRALAPEGWSQRLKPSLVLPFAGTAKAMP